MLGSEGVAAAVDPQRDVDIYLEEAARQGLKIAYVIETHLHADFVSGHRELAERTGAAIYLGAKAGAKFSHIGVKEGDEIRFGRCVLRLLETPGHTLESVCVLVTDLDRSPEAWAVLTGDTLFIGEVGRRRKRDPMTHRNGQNKPRCPPRPPLRSGLDTRRRRAYKRKVEIGNSGVEEQVLE